ncbi:MAG: hypothetical protein J6K01_07735 [Paludibacteraceae bacterium]|nr:hypothetical protein [Paludibacteraceae bacterium]
MKRIYFLAVYCLALGFVSCNDDKDNPVANENTQTNNSVNTEGNVDGFKITDGSISAVSLYKDGTMDGHDYVDLGLPSGTLWATANIGASAPYIYGNYYAWGEVTPQSYEYYWDTYKYGYGSGGRDYLKYKKYCIENSDGIVDNKTILDPEDDAAHVNWGGRWKMPTTEQQKELCEQCYWVWTENYNNSYTGGYIIYKVKNSADKGEVISKYKIGKGVMPSSVYSLSDVHIFLPATGYVGAGSFCDVERYGYYWSSSLHVSYSSKAQCLVGDSYLGLSATGGSARYVGLSVRAVISE